RPYATLYAASRWRAMRTVSSGGLAARTAGKDVMTLHSNIANERGNRGEAAVDIRDLYKWFGSFQVLGAIDLRIARGERVVVCGPSGSGKSTLIRCINGLEEFQRGEVSVLGEPLTPSVKRLDEVRRNVGMVFQQFNLFPHLTVLENCTLGP